MASTAPIVVTAIRRAIDRSNCMARVIAHICVTRHVPARDIVRAEVVLHMRDGSRVVAETPPGAVTTVRVEAGRGRLDALATCGEG